MTAQDIVLSYLQKYGRATHAELNRQLWLADCVVYNLPDVIYKLRNKGEKIETERFKYNGKRCTAWSLSDQAC